MKQELSESYLSHKYWQMHGDKIFGHSEGEYTYNGTITVAAEAADFAVTARDNASVEALTETKKVLIKLPNGTVSVELRWRYNGITGDQHVIRLYVAAGKDYFRWVDTITIDQGTQEHTNGAAPTGIKFISAVASAGEIWLTATKELTTTNEIGGYTLNMHGHDRLWIVATTLDVANAGTTLYTDWKIV